MTRLITPRSSTRHNSLDNRVGKNVPKVGQKVGSAVAGDVSQEAAVIVGEAMFDTRAEASDDRRLYRRSTARPDAIQCWHSEARSNTN